MRHWKYAALLLFAFTSVYCGEERRNRDDDDDGGGGATGSTSTTSSASSSSGGTSNDWHDVRCVDAGFDNPVCYGALGDHWAFVYPQCVIDEANADPGWMPVDAAEAICSTDTSGWSDIACYRVEGIENPYCFARLGSFWTMVWPDCDIETVGGTAVAPDPSAHLCGEGGDVPTGWDEFRCFSAADTTICYARKGAWWAGPGLLLYGIWPTCSLDFANEVPVSAAGCSSGGEP